jgi:hypothetical protein
MTKKKTCQLPGSNTRELQQNFNREPIALRSERRVQPAGIVLPAIRALKFGWGIRCLQIGYNCGPLFLLCFLFGYNCGPLFSSCFFLQSCNGVRCTPIHRPLATRFVPAVLCPRVFEASRFPVLWVAAVEDLSIHAILIYK